CDPPERAPRPPHRLRRAARLALVRFEHHRMQHGVDRLRAGRLLLTPREAQNPRAFEVAKALLELALILGRDLAAAQAHRPRAVDPHPLSPPALEEALPEQGLRGAPRARVDRQQLDALEGDLLRAPAPRHDRRIERRSAPPETDLLRHSEDPRAR